MARSSLSLMRFAAFWVPAFVAGAAAAVAVYAVNPSPWLAFFVLAVTVNALAKGLALVFERPRRPLRAAYLLVEVAFPSAILYLAFLAWGRMWLAVVVALLGAAVVNGAVRRLAATPAV